MNRLEQERRMLVRVGDSATGNVFPRATEIRHPVPRELDDDKCLLDVVRQLTESLLAGAQMRLGPPPLGDVHHRREYRVLSVPLDRGDDAIQPDHSAVAPD